MDIKYILIFLLIIPSVAGSIRINEVMANPHPCSDAYCEYVELYNDGNFDINVSGWFIGDEYQNDTIGSNPMYGNGSTIIPSNGYAIITDDITEVYNNFNVSIESIKLSVDGATIGNGLLNTGETFYLYDENETLVNSFSYSNTNNYEGMSCALLNKIVWCKAIPTPGYFNQGSFIDYFEGPCDWYINLILNKTEFEKDEFEFRVNVRKNGGGKTDVTLIRQVRDVYGNVVSNYNPLTKFLTYGSNFGGPWTPNYKPGMYFIETCIETNCNEIRLDNNCDEKLFVIKDIEPSTNSSIKFGRVYDLGSDNIARFGQIIKVKLVAYKGDTTKYSIKFYIEDEDGQRISKESKVNVENKFTNYSFTVPIQLIPNCGGKFKDGTYYIVGSGLGDKDKEKVIVEGVSHDLCEIVTEYKESVISSFSGGDGSESVLNEGVTGSVVYVGEKQESYIIYFFCFSLVMLIIYLLFKNE